ncbi:hypothetical protein THAR02_00593 [Trichoderma harzianum]|uniref:Uncharacterized protein n=1 Tax=Trichoderma harzianum TaxID=5544 RepID=A0A0G0AS09_TRIHA|nr:hypothetical protein THAR02_00593 [Trichoderma harzianum]
MARLLALLALSGAAMAAQSTTVSLLVPAADPQRLVGSVIGVDSAATTYAYGCAPGQPADKCGFESSQTITQGPTTWIYTSTYGDGEGDHYTEGGHCKLSSAADVASCSMWMTATDSTGSITVVTSVGTESFLPFQLPVTITAGLEKLQAAPGASATDSSAAAAPTNSNTGASETSQTTASSSGGSTTLARQTTAAVSTGISTSSTTATTAAPSSTNAAGFVNAQNGLLAGVAAIVGGVLLL